MDIKQNVYLVQEHFDDRFNSQITSKVSGKYKAVWQRQNGKCFYCGKKVTTHQQRKIIFFPTSCKPPNGIIFNLVFYLFEFLDN